MCAQKTSLTDISFENLKKIIGHARTLIPVGFEKHEKAQDATLLPQGHEDLTIIKNQYINALKQVGTLGGGNHFIEIQKGSDGYIWVMIHSGSRNLGYKVANYYNRQAEKLNEKWYSVVEKKKGLAFLPIESKEAHDYINEMNYCIDYALANRKLMMQRMMKSITKIMGKFKTDELINESHNFAAWEHHFGSNVLVHRKGATRAYEGELGMIPGSQGTKSYIVRGKGNEDSFKSCSHGAGRKLGRKQAIRELDLAQEIKLLEDQNILHSIRHKSDLDEAANAYKNIDVVMKNQEDLVDIVVEFHAMAGFKG
jgi:tRNA-splicing ligase RtcB